MTAREPLSPERSAEIAAMLADTKPARDGLLVQLAESVRDHREHDHTTQREDLYCLNLTSFMGERMGPVLRRLLDAEARVAELEAVMAAEPRATDGAVTQLARAVQALHTRHADSPHCQTDGEPWPCPTMTAVTEAEQREEDDAVRLSCGHGPDDLCEGCHGCPCDVCTTCKVCACYCQCVDVTAPAVNVAIPLQNLDDVESVTVDASDVVTVTVRPRDLDAWRWWLHRFKPVRAVTHRGNDTVTAKGTAPGGVTVCIVAHGVNALQAPAVAYITQRAVEGGEG